ncbi:MAG TPA: MOSC domain-containing protein [Mycobacteriales bacterium]|nr:MOSC domain-containing protein [Mycobacteriales bacterium]
MQLSMAELQAAREHLLAAPKDGGELRLIVARPRPGERELVPESFLDLVTGLVGDNWLERGSRHTPDGSAIPDMQVTVMNARVAALVAGGTASMGLAGDQLYVDLDLSVDNLPPGSRLAIGDAVLEVTAPPHTGCAKFVARFGEDAMRFVNSRDGRAHRLRGMNTRVVVPGTVRVGDRCVKVGVSRPAAVPTQAVAVAAAGPAPSLAE